MKRYLVLFAALGLSSLGMKADSHLRCSGFFENNYRTLPALAMVSVNGEPVDLVGMVGNVASKPSLGAYATAVDLGNGTYGVTFSHIPKDAHHLEITAEVPDPHHLGEFLSQTLIVDISHQDHIDLPVNILTD